MVFDPFIVIQSKIYPIYPFATPISYKDVFHMLHPTKLVH